ncbi:MAG: S9 family peptidase [Clostridiales bacterium]|nr:S9 family peptidase [Clostridiales bacterium]
MHKAFTPGKIASIEYLSEPAAAPDGMTFAYVLSRAEKSLEAFASDIFLYDVRKREHTKLDGDGSHKSPAWSPDGRHLAYLSDASGRYQVWVKALQGGAHRQLTAMRHGVECFAWSPDGTAIAFQSKVYPAEIRDNSVYTELSAEEYAAWRAQKAQEPIEITELMYKYDGEGILDGSRQAIGVALVSGGRPKLASADIPSFRPAWSTDGSKLAFYGRPHTGVKARSCELYICNVDGGRRKQLTGDLMVGGETPPCFTKDDSAVIIDVYPEFPEGGTIQSLYGVPMDGGKPYELFDRDAKDYMGINGLPVSRSFFGQAGPLCALSPDGRWMYYLLARRGGVGVNRLNLGSRETEPVVYGDFSVQAFCLTKAGDVLYTKGTPASIAELYFRGKRLTQHNAWLKKLQIAPVRELSVPTRDGEAVIQGWILSPAFREDGVKYPAVLEIRGGPEATSAADFWHEYQALAGAGFAVLYCNPRGSTGYGLKFMQNNAAWDKAADDLMDFVSAAVKLGFIDEKRIGVTGGSYGGYMANKLVYSTGAFAAAVLQRTLCNLCTSYGTGDIGFASAKGPVPADFKMFAYLTDRAMRSLICHIDEIKVPVLLLHGYADYRCSFEQAEQFFIALKERRPELPVRLVMFPEETHDITRTGKPVNQIRHLSELVDWFKKHLIDEPWEGVGGDEQAPVEDRGL